MLLLLGNLGPDWQDLGLVDKIVNGPGFKGESLHSARTARYF